MQNSAQNIEQLKNKVVTQGSMSRLLWRGLFVLFTLVFSAGEVSAQTLTGGTLYINGSFANRGTITVNNHIKNNTAGPVSVLPGTAASTVILTGAANANGHTIYGGGPISFYRLDIRGGRETRLKVSVEVTNRLQVGYAGNTFTAADSGFTIGNNNLTVDSSATYLGTANLTFAGGTVAYTSAVSQATINKTTGVRYGTLNFSGAGAKSISAAATGPDTAATLTQTGGQLSVLGNFDVTGTGSFADIGAISAAANLRMTGTVTSCSITSMNNTGTGIFENASNITAAITTLAGNSGTITQSGTTPGAIVFTNAATNTGTITNTSTGTITFNNTIANNTPATISNTSTGMVTFTNNLTGTGTVSQTAGGTMNVGAGFTQSTYSLTGTNGTVVYNGSAAQSVIGTNYYHLTVSTTGGNASASAAITLTGNLLVNSSSTLDMAGFTSSSFPGASNDNAGAIRWSGNNVYVRSAGATGTTEFYSSAAGNVAAGTGYRNILITGTNKTINNAFTATGNMTVNSGASVTVGSVTIQINGNVVNSGSLTNNGTINVGN
jgi:hypothetical protein